LGSWDYTSSGQPDKGDFSKAACRLRSLDFLAASRFFLLLPACIILLQANVAIFQEKMKNDQPPNNTPLSDRVLDAKRM